MKKGNTTREKAKRHALNNLQTPGSYGIGLRRKLRLDEFGYIPFTKAGAELLFEVISRAYERQSLIVTTNLPFEQWTEMLGNERLTGALLDRITHRGHILEPNPFSAVGVSEMRFLGGIRGFVQKVCTTFWIGFQTDFGLLGSGSPSFCSRMARWVSGRLTVRRRISVPVAVGSTMSKERTSAICSRSFLGAVPRTQPFIHCWRVRYMTKARKHTRIWAWVRFCLWW